MHKLIMGHEPYPNRNMDKLPTLDSLGSYICMRENPMTLLREIGDFEMYLLFLCQAAERIFFFFKKDFQWVLILV